MPSPVYLTSLRTGFDNSLLTKIQRLARAAGLEQIVAKRGLTAVKIHFGERGNTAFIRPVLVRPVVEAVLEAGGSLLTNSGTLYPDTRSNAVDHLNDRYFQRLCLPGCRRPAIIADGIDGRDEVAVPVNLQHFRGGVDRRGDSSADSLISLATISNCTNIGLWRSDQKRRNGHGFTQRQNGPAFGGVARKSFRKSA